MFTPADVYDPLRLSDDVMQWFAAGTDNIRYGEDALAADSISFHNLSADLMLDVHNYLYCCK